jgi:GNAT superfamily N-acetyltransferase
VLCRSPSLAHRRAIKGREDGSDDEQDRLIDRAGDRDKAERGYQAQWSGDAAVAGHESRRTKGSGEHLTSLRADDWHSWAMAEPRPWTLIAARADDADRLASLSRSAKHSYGTWADVTWRPPPLPVEQERWARRLRDPSGWTLIAVDSDLAVGTVHFTDAREFRGNGDPIPTRAHLSGLFVEPSRWGEGFGSGLLGAAVAEMRERSYRHAELFTATANRRSRSFYENRGWRPATANTHKHDGLTLVAYLRSF